MISPATPMKEAAERYSPLIADAFQKTLTVRPATKKSEAVRDIRVAQIPNPIVAATMTITKTRGIHWIIALDLPLRDQTPRRFPLRRDRTRRRPDGRRRLLRVRGARRLHYPKPSANPRRMPLSGPTP